MLRRFRECNSSGTVTRLESVLPVTTCLKHVKFFSRSLTHPYFILQYIFNVIWLRQMFNCSHPEFSRYSNFAPLSNKPVASYAYVILHADALTLCRMRENFSKRCAVITSVCVVLLLFYFILFFLCL